MRLRIGVDGKILGFIPIHWTLVAVTISKDQVTVVQALCFMINGMKIEGANYLSGTVFATLTQV